MKCRVAVVVGEVKARHCENAGIRDQMDRLSELMRAAGGERVVALDIETEEGGWTDGVAGDGCEE